MIKEYKLQTSFWLEFTAADELGPDAVMDTFKKAFDDWKHDYIYLTELCLVLNWKTWKHYENRPDLAEVYNDLWEAVRAYAYNTLKGAELTYFNGIMN